MNMTNLPKLLIALVILGALVLIATKVLGASASKAASLAPKLG